MPKLIGYNKNNTKRDVYSDEHLYLKKRKKERSQINNLNLHLKN